MEKFYKGEIQRLFPILEAIKEGKTIQWNDMGLWRDIDGDEEGFFLDTLIGKPENYRIKPEVKYRPFKDAEECWAEMLKHQPFGWVKNKESQALFVCKAIGKLIAIGIEDTPYTYKHPFDTYTFADGLPFGVKVEE